MKSSSGMGDLGSTLSDMAIGDSKTVKREVGVSVVFADYCA